MNKKLLLLALPALMVMSSCTYMEHATKVELFKEDTVANEQLFGELLPNRLGDPGDGPVVDSDWTKGPKVGVQFKSYQSDLDEDGTPEDYYAVRFVGLIKETEGMTATWSRAVSQKDSNQIKPMAHDKVSAVKYDTLNNAGSPVNASSEETGYDKYVVYSMYDIPASENESYIAAYLTLSKAEEEDVVSKVVIAQVDGSYFFSLIPDEQLVRDGYFLEYGAEDVITQDDEDPGENNAVFTDVDLETTDEFGLFKFSTSSFQFFGFSTFMSSSSASFIEAASVNQFGKVRLDGQYTLYVNNINFVYTQPKDVDVTFTFTPSEHWKEANAVFYLYAFNSDDPVWYKFTETGDAGVYSVRVQHWAYTKIIYVRKNPDNDDGSWDGKWNQSSDINVNFSSLSYVMSAEEWW